MGSVITYSYESKTAELNVDPDLLIKYGAVSEKVIVEMARGIREKFGTDYGVATSGIAGPGGGTPDKPVGTVWIAVSSESGVICKCYFFGNNRNRNIQRTAIQALDMLRKVIIEEEEWI